VPVPQAFGDRFNDDLFERPHAIRLDPTGCAHPVSRSYSAARLALLYEARASNQRILVTALLALPLNLEDRRPF
jgi:hypothetical protein